MNLSSDVYMVDKFEISMKKIPFFISETCVWLWRKYVGIIQYQNNFIWLINWGVNQGNYLAYSKFEFQILKNQISWYYLAMI